MVGMWNIVESVKYLWVRWQGTECGGVENGAGRVVRGEAWVG
jgi:hypothetical protein